ncbi:MAG: hypothetical protein IKO26_09240 [Paludibacteraceae bacterium]|nr:hypothetical protein [Paludibacteraceae bacterium]
MKKMTFIVCAAMLASAVLFTGCKKDENAPEKKNEVVKTEFSIALPQQLAKRYMPGKTVQVNGRTDFQGMTGITLIPFAKQDSIEAADARLGSNISLGDISAASELGTNSNAKVYTDVSIPLTTTSFLFYAESKATGTNFAKGSLSMSGQNGNTPAGIAFSLEPVVSALGTPTTSGTSGEKLIAYLNSIAGASGTVVGGTAAWKNLTEAQGAGLKSTFETFSTLKVLSSVGISNMLTDLYRSLAPLAATGNLAESIRAAIANNTYATMGGAGSDSVVLVSALDHFPAEFNLPDGAVRIKYDTDTKLFRVLTEAEYETDDNVKLNLITYPASLWYVANSQIKTSNKSKQALYDNSNDWDFILGKHTDSRAVNSLTRAVAIEDKIQYGVARLDVTVKLKGTTLKDNNSVEYGGPKDINCSSYQVTGVFVGGQKNVGYDFKPTTFPSTSPEYTIYDSVMSSTKAETPAPMVATTVPSAVNSTLVLESEVGASKDVRIAVELVNNSGEDFTGVDGCIVPKGGKFYLVALLKAAPDVTKTTDVTLNQVFKQDYTTRANLTINSLASAYNTIPDLRTPQLELGFSVDLEWTPGNVYDIEIP